MDHRGAWLGLNGENTIPKKYKGREHLGQRNCPSKGSVAARGMDAHEGQSGWNAEDGGQIPQGRVDHRTGFHLYLKKNPML